LNQLLADNNPRAGEIILKIESVLNGTFSEIGVQSPQAYGDIIRETLIQLKKAASTVHDESILGRVLQNSNEEKNSAKEKFREFLADSNSGEGGKSRARQMC